jgi:hypothetical protein
MLVYFKETQTPQENWSSGPGEQANSPEAIANGAGKITKIPLAASIGFEDLVKPYNFRIFLPE